MGSGPLTAFCYPTRLSTNWTQTGLYTQANNALLLRDADLAQFDLTRWKVLAKAGDASSAVLYDNNATPHSPPGSKGTTLWFTPMHGQLDLDQADELIANAKSGILPDVQPWAARHFAQRHYRTRLSRANMPAISRTSTTSIAGVPRYRQTMASRNGRDLPTTTHADDDTWQIRDWDQPYGKRRLRELDFWFGTR